jgi:hypothetical protein
MRGIPPPTRTQASRCGKPLLATAKKNYPVYNLNAVLENVHAP